MTTEQILYFVLGFNTGAVLTALVIVFFVRRMLRKLDAKLADRLKSVPPPIPQEAADAPTNHVPDHIAEKMEKIMELSNEQMHLAMAADGPQRSALDGKDKNRSIYRARELGEQIADLMEQIVKDGFDLKVMSIDMATGQKKVDRLSSILARLRGMNASTDSKTDSKPKLSVVHPPKDDDPNGGNVH